MNDKPKAIQQSEEYIRKLELRKIELENFTPVTLQQEERHIIQLDILIKAIKYETEYLEQLKKQLGQNC